MMPTRSYHFRLPVRREEDRGLNFEQSVSPIATAPPSSSFNPTTHPPGTPYPALDAVTPREAAPPQVYEPRNTPMLWRRSSLIGDESRECLVRSVSDAFSSPPHHAPPQPFHPVPPQSNLMTCVSLSGRNRGDLGGVRETPGHRPILACSRFPMSPPDSSSRSARSPRSESGGCSYHGSLAVVSPFGRSTSQ